jgi:hypothetical protein
MLKRVNGPVRLVCDDCKKTRHFSSFEKAVRFKAGQQDTPGGWRTSRSASGEFRDHCPSCVLKWKVEQELLS